MNIATLRISGLLLLLFIHSAFSDQSVNSLTQANTVIQKSLNKHCTDCHNQKKQKGKIRLDHFSGLEDNLQADLLSKIEEHVYTFNMPPEDEPQPSKKERKELFDTISKWHRFKGMQSVFKSKQQSPKFGNYLDHDILFSGEFKDLKGFTYDRDWVISEFIFKDKMNDLLQKNGSFDLDGKKQSPKGKGLPQDIANPFKLPNTSGVRYYANTKYDSSHSMTMIGNAKYVSDSIVGYLSLKNPSYLPAVTAISKIKFEQDNTIKSRREYMNAYVDLLCADLYKGTNESMLPTYKQIKLKGEISLKSGSYGRRGWIKSVDGVSKPYITDGINRFARKGVDKMQIIRNAERYYFHLGLDEKFIERLLYVFQREITKILYNFKNAARPKIKISESEKKVIEETIRKVRAKGMTYYALMDSCEALWNADFIKVTEKSNKLNDEFVHTLISQIHTKMFDRIPTEFELKKNAMRLRALAAKLGMEGAIRKIVEAYFMHPEFSVRSEYGTGTTDKDGRKMLSPRDASYAIAYALTDSAPDAQLAKSATEGKLKTKEDYKREVERILKSRKQVSIINDNIHGMHGMSHVTYMPIRKLRFFREFFGYHKALKVFKDRLRFNTEIAVSRPRLIVEADMIVEDILEKDKNVFEELLTTDKFYVFHTRNSEEIKKTTEHMAKAYKYFKGTNWLKFKSMEDIKKHKKFLTTVGLPGFDAKRINWNKKPRDPKRTTNKDPEYQTYVTILNILASLELKFESGKNKLVAPSLGVRGAGVGIKSRMQGGRRSTSIGGIGVANYFNINPGRWDYPAVQPAKIENRMGMLTHPAWLQAFSHNLHTDPVIRGKWVREKLLAGVVPEVPIGVDAKIPDLDPEHPKTLRDRLDSKTRDNACWKCHKHMNPLGNAFEMYDDFGRYRTGESLEHPKFVTKSVGTPKVVKLHPDQKLLGRGGRTPPRTVYYKTIPIDTTGSLVGTGDSKLDGDVKDAHDLIGRLVKSKRVRQSIIRHAFRYFMGRNEMWSDSKTLIDADQAYLKSGGSFDAVIVSLLSSDSFIYRKAIKE